MPTFDEKLWTMLEGAGLGNAAQSLYDLPEKFRYGVGAAQKQRELQATPGWNTMTPHQRVEAERRDSTRRAANKWGYIPATAFNTIREGVQGLGSLATGGSFFNASDEPENDASWTSGFNPRTFNAGQEGADEGASGVSPFLAEPKKYAYFSGE